jgi:hypothetical protein
MTLRKTPIAAEELGISYYHLISLLRSKKLPAPQKDSSGDYIWTDADLDAAREALRIDHRRKSNRDTHEEGSGETASPLTDRP